MDVQTAIVSSMFDTNSTDHFSVSRKYTRFANSVAAIFTEVTMLSMTFLITVLKFETVLNRNISKSFLIHPNTIKKSKNVIPNDLAVYLEIVYNITLQLLTKTSNSYFNTL